MAFVLAWLAALALFQDRLPEPDAAALKENQKLIRDLFKDEYARKSPADQKSLAQKLYKQALQSKDDPKAFYALLQEARDVAAAGGDVETVIGATDELARTFAVDGPALKLATLTRLAAGVKDGDAAEACARGLFALIPDAVKAGNFDAALGAAEKAQTLAKPAQDATILSRAMDLQKDIASIKAEAARVKPFLENPVPAEAEAVGRYLCFVKGDWNAGLPPLIAGAKPPLKSIVDKEVLKPVEPEKQADLAEAWLDFAQKEKSTWRRGVLIARARLWLEKAAETATGLTKMRVEKRLAETGTSQPGVVNLLRLIDPKEDMVEGVWTMEGAALVSPIQPWARVQIPYAPPDEYDLSLMLERTQGDNAVGVGLVHGTTSFTLFFDTYPDLGCKSGVDILDGLTMNRNPLALTGPLIRNNVPLDITIAVRKTGVTATIDGKVVYRWEGNYNRLSQTPVFTAKDPRMLVVGAFEGRVLFTKITLTAVSGQGKKLR